MDSEIGGFDDGLDKVFFGFTVMSCGQASSK